MNSDDGLLLEHGVRCQIKQDGLHIKEQALPSALQDSQSAALASSYYGCFALAERDDLMLPQTLDMIPYSNILSCKQVDEDVYRVYFAVSHDKSIKIKSMNVTIEDMIPDMKWQNKDGNYEQSILRHAYGNRIPPGKPISVLVVVNPHSGQGKSKEIFNSDIKPVLEAADVKYTVKNTEGRNHATEIARTLNVDDYDIIACVSGDGTPHEIINGFYQRDDKGVSVFNKIAVTQLPGGSGNALSLSTHGSNDAALATFNMLKAKPTKIDLMAVKQLDSDNVTEKVSLSFLSQCYGAIADSDIGTESLRWMGPIRFDLGVAHKVLTRTNYPCDLYIHYVTTTKEELLHHYDQYTGSANKTANSDNDQEFDQLSSLTEDDLCLSGPNIKDPVPNEWIQVDPSITSSLSIFYIGKMPYVSSDTQFFPAALPNDGSMDLIITTNSTPIMKTVTALLSVSSGKHIFEDNIMHHKILGYRLVPRLPKNSTHYLSIDGENFPMKTFQVEILPGVLTSLLNEGCFVETCLTKQSR